MAPKTEKKSYSDTVHLPKTEFPMRGNMPEREPQWAALWEKGRVFEKMASRAEGRGRFVLHDGPPYANGRIHIGHALNKVLKDMVVKSRSLMGFRTPYIPGWDCHGLPIEHELLKEKKSTMRQVPDVPAFRREAAAFADRFIELQREDFKRLGVFGSWDAPYKTMSRRYESAILRAFRLLYKKGFVYRGLKTVSWCVTCETALAEAEIEYKIKTSPSVYAAMPITGPSEGFPFVETNAAALIWTTTPWTLPANRAAAFHPELDYVLVSAAFEEGPTRALLLAKARLSEVMKAIGGSVLKELGSWKGRELVSAGLVCETPFAFLDGFPWKESRGVLADYVSAEDGTGIVHTAPGHGADDYLTGKKNGLEILCPVDGAGRFTAEAGKELEGKRIFKEGNPAVIELLTRAGRMFGVSKIEHNYQHCWRCRQPIAFRATDQWWLSVSHEGLRENLLKSIDAVEWVPAQGRERISAMVASRPDWCLSRQRLWGTPIPIFLCWGCGDIMADDDALEAVEKRVAAEGSDFWFADFEKPVVFGAAEADGALPWDFMPEKVCGGCGGRTFRRDPDILDVWMDSGASWLGVLGEDEVPCDLYLEGSDQHRGWFQSSLVMAVALTGSAPYKTVLTHGFVLDDNGRAMSKSIGNVVAPQEVVGKLGADVLRLWVALADYSEDVRLSKKLLDGPTDIYRKLRNTFKYLLGNTCDFDPARDAVVRENMPELERCILLRLAELDEGVRAAYGAYAFRKAATSLVDFCNLTLSAFYLDARKDALYTLKASDPVRRAAQTVMWECLLRITRLASPIVSFTCEEVWQELRRSLAERGANAPEAESVFLSDWGPAPAEWRDERLAAKWEPVMRLREGVQGALEEKRSAKEIGAPLQARWTFHASDPAAVAWFNGFPATHWPEVTITSGAAAREAASAPEGGREVAPGPYDGKAWVTVEKAPGEKCPRCWRYPGDFGSSPEDPSLCGRCVEQLTG